MPLRYRYINYSMRMYTLESRPATRSWITIKMSLRCMSLNLKFRDHLIEVPRAAGLENLKVRDIDQAAESTEHSVNSGQN